MQDIIRKFRFRDNGVVLNVPVTLEKELVKPGFKTIFDKKVKSANTVKEIISIKAVF